MVYPWICSLAPANNLRWASASDSIARAENIRNDVGTVRSKCVLQLGRRRGHESEQPFGALLNSKRVTPILGEWRRPFVRLVLLPAEQSHVGMRGRRYHLITGQVETVCQNRCPVLTDVLSVSDNVLIFLCEVEPFGSRAILLPTSYLGQCSLWLIFCNQCESFYRARRWGDWQSGETARTCTSSFVRASDQF